MIFTLLGPLEVHFDGELDLPSATKIRWTLAQLLLRANQVVDRSAIIDELWGEQPPRSALTTAQTYIYQLRKRYRARFSGPFITTRAPGYVLHADPAEIDTFVFERLTEEGGAALVAGDAVRAADRLRAALALWRGPVLSDIPAGPILTPYITHLDEIRMRALRMRTLADAHLGRYRELIPELRFLTHAHPYDEWLHEQLIVALHAVGRRADALETYQRLQRTLDRELGIAPSQPLHQLHHDVLVGVERPRSAEHLLQSMP
ncbi:AfsR/SARP family transcriptional regulator [Amycolatopsis speibonae]|uniref:BTAD domain-containing putative transcriptional regulator n=1 Tax=Amycolatopsis speibonae TaxID=1450224 RepID=A0ABV7NSP8_9PSEU